MVEPSKKTVTIEGPEGPRRKSMAGPMLMPVIAAPGASKRSFAVTNTFFRGQEKGALENMLKGVAASDDLAIDGGINIVSAVETTKEVLCCKYTEEFEGLAVGFTDGMIRLFKSTTAECIQTLYDAETQRNQGPVTSIKHRPVSKNYPLTNSLTCSYSNGCVKCWNYNFCQCIYTIREKRQTFGLTYHPRLPKFVTFGDDCKIFLYDEETRTQERILTASEAPGSLDGHTSRVFSACFNPRSNHEFLSGGWDDTVFFWDLRQPHAVRHISNVHICGDGIDISPKGTEILTCAWQRDKPMQLWDYGSGNLMTTIEPDVHNSLLYCGSFINKDYVVAGGIEPNLVRIVDMRTFASAAKINGLPGGVYSLDVGPYKKTKRPDTIVKIGDLGILPKIAFVCGKKAYQIDFS